MLERVLKHGPLLEPVGCTLVQTGGSFRVRARQLGQEQFAEQVVVAVPFAPPIQRDKKQVRARQRIQPCRRPIRLQHPITQLGTEPAEHRRSQQKRPGIGVQRVQHLGGQIISDVAVAGRELPQVLLGRVGVGQPHPGQPDPSRPALGALRQELDVLTRERADALLLEELHHLVHRERERVDAQLAQVAAGTQPAQPDGRVRPGGRNDPSGMGQALHRVGHRSQAFVTTHMVEIIEHDHDSPRETRKPIQQLVDRQLDIAARSPQRGQCRPGDSRPQPIGRGGNRRPQTHRLVIDLLQRYPRDRSLRAALKPRRHHHRLARACWRADQREGDIIQLVKPPEQARPRTAIPSVGRGGASLASLSTNLGGGDSGSGI